MPPLAYSIDSHLLTPATISTFRKNYGEIILRAQGDRTEVDLHSLSPDQARMLALDLAFYERNPNLPLENLCSHLDNYNPQNETQTELLAYARRLVDLEDDSSGSGLFMYGDAGIGKSHVAIGISKLFMERGLNPQFLVAEKYTFTTHVELQPGQVWIIDDMNSGFHISSRLFRQVVLNAHERGGRVFVTSNKEYDELMKELFVGDSKANLIRYTDRTKGMFKILHVQGSSFRQAHAWYK